MELLRDFRNVCKKDSDIAGGKGASLGEMTQAGIPVPPGFVILATAFERFLEETDLNVEVDSILRSVDTDKMHTIEDASEKIHALIVGAEIPADIATEIQESFKNLGAKYVAVRSSATAEDSASAAWAGQLESYLNTTEENLLEQVKRCWASLFTPRAIFYRFEKDLHKQRISVAVVVQKMVESEKSGIAFSVHPVTQDRNQLIIEAGLGLGEAIVSGQITPDSYVVGKQPRRIIDANIQTQTKGLYRAKKGGSEWRDISKEQGERQVLPDGEILELSELILKIEDHYGFPCDIEWAFESGKFYIVQSRPITTIPTNDTQPTFPVDPNMEIFRWGPIASRYFYVADYLHALTAGFSKDYMGYFWPKAVVLFHNNELVWVHDFAELRKIGGLIFEKQVLFTEDYLRQKKAYRAAVKKLRDQEKKIERENVASLTDKKLALMLIEMNRLVTDCWLPTLPAEIGNYGSVEVLQQKLSECIEDDKVIEDVIRALTTSERLSFYQEEEIELQETDDLRNHQRKYFWLHNSYAGVEYLGVDFFEKRKNALEKDLRAEYVSRVQNIKSEKVSVIKKHRIPDNLVEMANRILDAMEWQDERKKEIWILQHYKQILLREVERRTKRNDLVRYGLWELADMVQGKDLRRAASFGFILESGTMSKLGEETTKNYWEVYTKEKIVDSKNIGGIVANKGHVIGKVQIIRDPKDESVVFEEGDILVAPMTSPDYVFLMKKSAAVVTDAGGLTSHAAIVSRELGKPCIVGTKIATQILKTGDRVEVDADNGVVKILSKKDRSTFESEMKAKEEVLLASRRGGIETIVALLKKHTWVWRWSGNWPLLDGVIQRDDDFYKELKQVTGGMALECNVDFYEGPILTTYHSQQEYDRLHQAIRRRFEEDHSFLIGSFDGFDTKTQKDLQILEEIANEFEKGKKLSSAKLAELFELSRKPWAYSAAMDLYCLYAEDAVLPILRQFIERKLGRKDKGNKIISYLTKLTTPVKPTQFLFERKSFFEIVDVVRSDNAFGEYLGSEESFEECITGHDRDRELLASHLKKYDWLPILVNNPPMSFSNVCNELRSYLLKDPKDYSAEIRNMLDLFSGKTKKEAQHIITELKPDKKIQLLIDGLQEMAYVRTQTGVVLSRSAYLMIPLYTEIAERLGTTYHDLKVLLPEQIVRHLKEENSARSVVAEQKPLVVYINDGENRHVFTKRVAFRIKDWLVSQTDRHVSGEELRGVPANPGIKRGVARIVLNSKEIHTVEDGEVLVAPATSVDFVPAMRKAAAIITETGGITSHAAIVSRELGVPCIVGVKQATKILKCGSLVEVDANNGLVTILG